MKEPNKKEVKARKIKDTKVFDIPKGINPTDGIYVVFQGRHGDIVYRPKRPNIFKDPTFIKGHDFKQEEAFHDTLKGNEDIW